MAAFLTTILFLPIQTLYKYRLVHVAIHYLCYNLLLIITLLLQYIVSTCFSVSTYIFILCLHSLW